MHLRVCLLSLLFPPPTAEALDVLSIFMIVFVVAVVVVVVVVVVAFNSPLFAEEASVSLLLTSSRSLILERDRKMLYQLSII